MHPNTTSRSTTELYCKIRCSINYVRSMGFVSAVAFRAEKVVARRLKKKLDSAKTHQAINRNDGTEGITSIIAHIFLHRCT